MFYPIPLRIYTYPATHISCLQPQFPWRVTIPKWLPSGCLQERLERKVDNLSLKQFLLSTVSLTELWLNIASLIQHIYLEAVRCQA